MIQTLVQELRQTVRGLARQPGFTAAALVTLAFGIGANTTVFSIVDALLLRPLPFGDLSDRIVTLHSTHRTQAEDWDDARLAPADLLEVKDGGALEDAAGYIPRNLTLTDGAEAERLRGGSITTNLFPMLGIEPAIGRPFEPGEAHAIGFEPVVILSHGLWQRRFGGDPQIVGKSIGINRRALVVIGVMPERFKFPERDELWVPLRLEPGERSERSVMGYGLLRRDGSVGRAQQALDGVAARAAERYPDTNRGWGIRVFAFRDLAVGREARLFSTALLAAVAFVLLIGCANLANLLLARCASRGREMALRAAVGASQGRLVRQLLVESLLLAALGSALGVLAAAWSLDALVASFPEELPYWLRFEVDGRALVFTVALAVLTALAFGLIPALRSSRPDLIGELKEGGRGALGSAGHHRLQGALVVGQIALCLALLAGANLLIRSFMQKIAADAGFDPGPLLSLRLYLSGDAYDPVEAKAAFFRRAVEAVRALPGVRQAAFTSSIPADDGGAGVRLVADGQPVLPGEETGASLIPITAALFETLDRPMLEGRAFSDDEVQNASAEVAIVNRGLARRFWPDSSAVGRRVGIVEAPRTVWLTIVGVAPEIHYEEIGEETAQSRLNIYVPYARAGYRTMALLVRAEGDPGSLAAPLRAALRRLDAGLPSYELLTMRERRTFNTWEERLFGRLMGVFAAAALFLACLGVYGVLAHAVSRRTQEIGVRIALGASRRDILGLVLGRGALLAGLGVAAGLGLAIAMARVLSNIVYGVDAESPWMLAGMAAVLGVVVLAASVLPARRAASIDPMAALRCE